MNQVVDREKFFGNLLKTTGYGILFLPSKYSHFPYAQYFEGKRICFKDYNVIVLFEKCDWCGSSKGVKMDLNGNDICLACGGPV